MKITEEFRQFVENHYNTHCPCEEALVEATLREVLRQCLIGYDEVSLKKMTIHIAIWVGKTCMSSARGFLEDLPGIIASGRRA